MRIRASCSIGVLLVLAMAGSARAQDDRRIHVNFGGGPTFNFGELGERFSTGWGPAVGVEFVANPRVGIQFEYAYRWFQVKDELDIQAGRFSANHQTHQLAFNVITRLTSPDSPVRVYFTAGPGMYHRGVDVTEYEGNGVVCDPWLYSAEPIRSSRLGRHAADGTSASTWAAVWGCRSVRDSSFTSRRAITMCWDRNSLPRPAFRPRRRLPSRRRTASTGR